MVYAYAALTVTDPNALAAYREKAGEALARHGGAVVTASADTTPLDGTPTSPGAAALLSFPDKAAALAWAGDAELADIHALRRAAGQSDILLLA